MIVSILGTEYTIEERTRSEDAYLKDHDGYCDKTSKLIVIDHSPDDSELDDYEAYKRKVLRHEIIHAFLFESGLHENFTHPSSGHDETYVDWIAVQFPKMLEVFKKAGCI